MKINSDEIVHIAKLANLTITTQQADVFSKQLSAVLDYVDHLNQAPTDLVDPLFNVNESKNVFKEDKVIPGLSQEECLKNSKSTFQGFFKVKSIF